MEADIAYICVNAATFLVSELFMMGGAFACSFVIGTVIGLAW